MAAGQQSSSVPDLGYSVGRHESSDTDFGTTLTNFAETLRDSLAETTINASATAARFQDNLSEHDRMRKLFHQAASEVDESVVRAILDYTTEVDIVDVDAHAERSRTPLMVACISGDESLVRTLLACGAKVERRDLCWRYTTHLGC